MQVTSLVDNCAAEGFETEHGLSLHIAMSCGKKFLFDTGQSGLFINNAHKAVVDILAVDACFISHGHYDHGGGIGAFLKENLKANVYIDSQAFKPRYSLHDDGLHSIGIDRDSLNGRRLVLCDETVTLPCGISFFSGVKGDCLMPSGNNRLKAADKVSQDAFPDERSLLIEENGKLFLFAGCAHHGIVNIIERAMELTGKVPSYVFSGFHTAKSGLDMVGESAYINALAQRLLTYKDCMFYTMHCTSYSVYLRLRDIMGERIDYLSCGRYVKIN